MFRVIELFFSVLAGIVFSGMGGMYLLDGYSTCTPGTRDYKMMRGMALGLIVLGYLMLSNSIGWLGGTLVTTLWAGGAGLLMLKAGGRILFVDEATWPELEPASSFLE